MPSIADARHRAPDGVVCEFGLGRITLLISECSLEVTCHCIKSLAEYFVGELLHY